MRKIKKMCQEKQNRMSSDKFSGEVPPLLFKKKKKNLYILMALFEYYRSGVTNLKITSQTFLLICVMSPLVFLLCLLEFCLLL